MIPFTAWLRATGLGWLHGVPLIVVLALAGEAVGIGGSQVLVGLGMGLGVGLLQGRVIRPLLGRSAPWVWSSAVGLSLPFLATDVAALREWNLPYSLEWCVVTGGLIVGLWQALLLGPRVRGAAWWVAGSAAGWALAAVVATLADDLRGAGSLRGIGGAAIYLGTVVAGGLVLGLTTGLVLQRLSQPGRTQPSGDRASA